MNRLAIFGASLLVLAGCTQSKGPTIDLGDMEDYLEFMEERNEDEELEPFKAEPLVISATGKVRAEPDIAVITATITGEDKNESKAVNVMSGKVNAVQAALANRQIETGFTAVSSQREFDEGCQNHNAAAWQRQYEIQSDYHFNRRLDQAGDTETKRRVPKPRIAQKVCAAQSIKVATTMTIRIQPAEAAGEALRALAESGSENSRLFGYDFTDYDSHYQKAAEKAVEMAREKAEAHARLTGTTLGEIEKFTVSPPERTGRFGPQPNVIRSARRYRGQRGSVVDRQVNRPVPRVTKQVSRRVASPPPVASFSCWDGSVVSGLGQCPSAPQTVSYSDVTEDEVVVTGSRIAQNSYTSNAPVRAGAVSGGYGAGYTSGQPGQTTNALSMSLLSGPQTIAVTATLHYDYETPLDGKIIVDEKQN